MKTSYKTYLELCKIRIAILSSFSAAVGFLLTASHLQSRLFVLVPGVFLLACGSSALNHYQERDLDATMPRTINRPVPSGRIQPRSALSFSIAVICSGCSALFLTGSLSAPLFGLFAVVWYNRVYTYLKKKTAFAVIPGALVGALPPVIGWVGGGGAIGDTKLMMIFFFFFLWQVPHSLLFMMKYGPEYERAGFPSPTSIFSSLQMQRIIFSWIFATAVSCLFLSAMGMVHSLFIHIALLLLSAWLVWNGIKPILCRSAVFVPLPFFHKTNYYLLGVMLLLSADKLFTLT
jgi:protoheme IX farnesyltransferase